MDGMNVEQQFSLSWNNFHGNVSRELSALLGSGTLADVTLAVGGELLQAHRLVLAICSPYFKRMFQSNPHHHPIVVLRDVTHKAMRDLLQFMYHGEVSVKREDLTSFIATAELLQIKGLTNKDTEDEDREQELPKATPEAASTQQRLTEIASVQDDEVAHAMETKTKLLNEKIQRLKRASEFLQSNYCHEEQPEKRPRSAEKARFDKFYDESPADMSYSEMQKHASEEEKSDQHYEVSELDLKTECDDGDVIVTEAAMQYATRQFDSEHANKDLMPSLQDDASGLGSIFMDLKSIVNGKYTYRSASFPCDGRCRGGSLTTIPQKEDGKKKYPQRSCRSCWKIGKRRDTRFMCNYCGVPFCKTPCFDIHLRTETVKIGSYEGEYALT